MPRVKRGSNRRQKRKKILSRAKGYFQAKSKLYRYAREAVDRSEKFAYIGRRLKKRDFRSLWITRIGAAAEQHSLSYSRFIYGLKLAEIDLNRKMLSEMAVSDADSFGKLVELAKAAIEAPPKTTQAAASSETPKAAPEPAPTPGSESPAEVEAAAPEPPAEEPKAAPKKPRARKKPAAADESSESKADAQPAKKPAKKRAPAKKKSAASKDDATDT